MQRWIKMSENKITKTCEHCNKETFHNLTKQPYELLNKNLMVCPACWEDEQNKINSRRIQKQKIAKQPKKVNYTLKEWVKHLHDKHNISEIKLHESFIKVCGDIIKGLKTDVEYQELSKQFCIDLDAKLHYIPFAMKNKCDNYNPNKNKKCQWCKVHRPSCYSFAPNKEFKESQKQKYSIREHERNKQKTFDNTFEKKPDISNIRQKSRMNYKIKITGVK
jgi:hypothetical protein